MVESFSTGIMVNCSVKVSISVVHCVIWMFPLLSISMCSLGALYLILREFIGGRLSRIFYFKQHKSVVILTVWTFLVGESVSEVYGLHPTRGKQH